MQAAYFGQLAEHYPGYRDYPGYRGYKKPSDQINEEELLQYLLYLKNVKKAD